MTSPHDALAEACETLFRQLDKLIADDRTDASTRKRAEWAIGATLGIRSALAALRAGSGEGLTVKVCGEKCWQDGECDGTCERAGSGDSERIADAGSGEATCPTCYQPASAGHRNAAGECSDAIHSRTGGGSA